MDPPGVKCLRDFESALPCNVLSARPNGRRGIACGQDVGTLRIGFGFKARATTRIRFTGEQRTREAIRAAKGIGSLHEIQQRLGLEFERAMHDAVEARDD